METITKSTITKQHKGLFWDDAHAYMYVYSEQLDGYRKLICTCPLEDIEKITDYEGICPNHGRVGPGPPQKLHQLKRKKVQSMRSEPQPDLSRVRRNCFRTFKNRQEALDQKHIELQAQIGSFKDIIGKITPGIITNASKTLSSLEELSQHTTTLVDNINEQVNNVNNDKQTTKQACMDYLQSIPGKVKEFLDSSLGEGVMKNLTIRNAIIFIAVTIGILILKHFLRGILDSFSGIKEIFDLICSFIVLPAGLLKYVWHYIRSTELKAQTFSLPKGKDDVLSFISEYVPLIFPLAGTVMTAFMLNKLPGKPATPDLLLRRCRDLPGAVKGLGDIYAFISKYWTATEAYIKESINGPDPLSPLKGFPDIDKWMKDVLHYSDHKVFKEAIADKEKNFTIMQLWFTGMNLLTTYRKALDRETAQSVQLMLRTCAQMKSEAEKSGVWNSGPRMEPQMVWLTGGSGVGKSSMIYYLAAHILKPLGLANKIKEAVYLRTVEQEYWDGYRNQPLVAVDDAFQIKDGAANPNVEFMEAIRMSNMFPLNLHMADLSEKATTMFNGKCVLYTTNNRNPNIESLTYPEAFYRRFTHSYEVRIKKEFQKERIDSSGRVSITLDATKAKASAPEIDGKKQPINLDVYEFAAFDPWTMHGREIPETYPTISFNELAAILEEDMRDRVSKSDTLLTDVQKYADILHAQCNSQDEFSEPTPNDDLADLMTKLREFLPAHLNDQDKAARILDMIEYELTEIAENEKKAVNTSYVLATKRKFITDVQTYVREMTKVDEPSPYNKAAKLVHSMYTSACSSMKKAYDYVCSFEWTKLLSFIKKILTSYTFLIPAAAIGSFYLLRSMFGKGKKPRKYYNWTNAESFHPETQPLVNRPPLVTESFHPETQPRLAHPPLVTESFHPETQPRLARPALVTESFHPETQPVIMRSMLVTENYDPTTKLTHAETTLLSENAQTRITEKSGIKTPEGLLLTPDDLTAQGCVDANQYQMIEMVARQQYQILGAYPSGVKPMGNGIVVKGSIFLTCQHFIYVMNRNPPTHVIFRNSYLPNGIVATYDDFKRKIVEVENKQDLVLVDMTRCLPPGKDITKHFISRDSLPRLTSFRAVLSGHRHVKESLFLSASSGSAEVSTEIRYTLAHDDGTKQQVNAIKTICYDIDTKDGDCGMILTVSDYQLPAKIVGLHVAGTDKIAFYNFASLTTAETLRETVSKHFPLEAQVGQSFEVFNSIVDNAPLSEDLPFKGEFLPIGKVFTSGEALKTRIKPSIIWGALSKIKHDGENAVEKWNKLHPNNPLLEASTAPCLKVPARLCRFTNDAGEIVDPLLKGIEKAGLPALTCSTKYLDMAAQAVASNLYHDRAKTNRPKRLLTHEEAIKGISDKEGINGISRVTSPGYPWSQMPHKGKGKTHWMGHHDWDFTSEGAKQLKEFCDEQEVLLRQGQRLDVVWIDTLKDEIISQEKRNLGKTRVFSNGPMHYTVLFRKYFMMFMAHVMDNRIYNEVAVGINTNSIEWQVLANKITSKGPKVFDGDFASYDGTLVAKILWKVLDIINDWYDDGPTNRLARSTLWFDIVHSIHSCRGDLYQWTHSIPSGCPITAIVNSIYNSLSMRVVYLEMAPMKSMKYFEQNVSMCSYGDDNVVNISDEICQDFNQIIAAEGYRRIGMTYTDADKESELSAYKDISRVSFLKRFWVKDDYLGFYGAPSTLKSRLDILNWTRTDNNTDPTINEEQTVSSVARELAILGEDVFNYWTPLIRKAYSEAGKKMPIIESYTHYMDPMSAM